MFLENVQSFFRGRCDRTQRTPSVTPLLSHFFMYCHHFMNIRSTLLDDLQSVSVNIPRFSDNKLVDLLLYGRSGCNSSQNNNILSSISFIVKSETFNGSFC